jgi:hypothetical protein
MPISNSGPDSSLYVDTQELSSAGHRAGLGHARPHALRVFWEYAAVLLVALSAAGSLRHHYSALISPQESNLRVVDTSPISKPQCSPKILPSISSSTESATTGKKSIPVKASTESIDTA